MNSAACKPVRPLSLLMVCTLALLLVSGCGAKRRSPSANHYMDDATITTNVKTAMFSDPLLRNAEISVETVTGVVQLSGFVDSQQAVRRAGDVTASVPGVVSVKNDLIVK